MTALPEQAPASAPAWHPAATLAAAVAAIFLIVAVAQRGFAVAAPALATLPGSVIEALFTLALAAALIAVALIGRHIDRGRAALIGPAPARMAGFGFGVGGGGLLAAVGLAALAALVRRGGGDGAGAAGLLIGTVAILVQTFAEELYFRGWLQPVLARAWGALPALLVAAAAFAAPHLAGGARAPLSLLNLFLGGLLFGLLALRSGGLTAPVAAHFAWNWAEQILTGLDPNPGTGSFGAILDLDLVGSATWGGSDEGLNASLPVTFVLIALIVPLAAWRSKPR